MTWAIVSSLRCVLTAACCLWCGTAVAEADPDWHYSAPPECPSEQQFRDQVSARLLRDPRATASAENATDAARVSVEIRLEPSEHRASLVLKEPGTPPVERTVEGDSCAELASGLALITALAFGAAREPTDPAATEPKPATPPNAAAPASPPPPPPVTPPPAASPPVNARATASSPRLQLEAGAGGSVNSWSAPDGALGADAFVRLSPEGGGWSLRVAGLYAFGASYVGERRADFTFWGGRAEGCPLSQPLPLKLVGEGCLALELGALHGRGDAASALLEGASQTVFSATAVLLGRLRARWAERVSLEGQGELGLPLVRDEFVFEEPSQRIFRTPTLGFAARIGLGVKFL